MLLVCLTALANPSSSFQLRTTGISTGRPDRCEVPLDEVLLSRQLLVYGRGAQTQLGRAHVVLAPAGCSTVLLGEVSRQLVMIGLGRLSIVAADRDQIAHVLRMLEDFNSAVDIQIHHTLEDIKDHVDAVIAVDMSLSETAALNLVCRERKTKMFACRVIGPTGYVFCDLQSHWVLSHTAHEPASSVPLLSLILDGDDRAHIKCIEDERMPVGVNDSCVIKVGATNVTATVVSMVSYREALVTTSFRNQGKLADLAADFGSKGGSVQKIVPVSLVKHKCFGDVINRPSFESINGCLAPEESMEKSIGVLAAHIAHDVALLSPSVCSSTSPKFVKNRFIKSAKNAAIFLKERMNSNEVNSDKASAVLRPLSRAARWLRSGMRLGPNFSITCRGLLESFFQEAFLPSLLGGGRRKDLMVSSVTAGVISQEVVKAVTNTDMPISQLLMFENLVPQLPLRSELKNRSLRDGRCARILVVGAGAIGCEVLRNLALGIDNTAERGRNRAYLEDEGIIYIADNDAVEKSNLNRQLLFR